MGLGHSPRIVTDGLVLALDAANPRNFNLTAVEVLVVAGGGSGGVDNGGGGGGGGLIYNSNFAVTPGTQLAATVGAGGAARAGGSDDGPGNNGANSVFGSLTAYGGGGGSGWINATLPPGSSSYTGGNGAGQSASTSSGNSLGAGTGNRVTGTTTVASGQGNNGGTAVGAFAGGGGGGGGSGGNASNGAAGAGGLGFRSNISGSQAIYAAGGAGGWDILNGYTSTLPFTENGTVKKTTQTSEDACPANTGHGGNGGNTNNNSSGAGGSGIIIVRYQGPQRAIGGTVTSVGGDTIHTFTTSGNFTPLVNTNGSAVLGLSDLSGNRNFGDSGGSGVLYSSANGGSLSFDGSDDHISVIPINRLTTTTLDIWFNASSVSSDTSIRQYLYTQQRNPPTLAVYTYQERQGIHISGNVLQFQYLDTTNNDGNIVSISTISANTWYNLVVTLDGTTPKMYLNGTQLSVTGNLSTPKSLTVNQAFVGRRGDANGADLFGGKIASVRDYNRALTAAEIQQNFIATRSRYGI